MPAGDMDVDVDPRTGRWWEVLTSNSLRMREFERSIKACGMSFEPVTKALSGEVDEALKKVYYEQFPGERARWRGEWRLSPSSSRSNSGGVGAATTDPTTTYGYTHAIPNFEKAKSVFNEILSQRRADASGSSTMASDSIANFLRERYPSSAPFNSEALLASGLRGLGIDDGRRGGGGNAFHPDTGPRRESPHPNKRTKLSVASSHDPFVPPGYYAHSGTHTLRSESTARSPSTWTSPRQSGSPTDASSSPSERRRGSFGSAHSVLSFSPTRGRGRFPATTRNDFIHRSKSLNNTCGRKEGGGQKKHSCEDCGMAFPYPSKLRDHRHIHSETKEHVCPSCTSRFRRKRELKAHYKTHKKREASDGVPQQKEAPRCERSDSQAAPVPAAPPPQQQWSESVPMSGEASPSPSHNDACSDDKKTRFPPTTDQCLECLEGPKERLKGQHPFPTTPLKGRKILTSVRTGGRPFDNALTHQLFPDLR